MKVNRKFRFYPDESQKAILTKVFGHSRFVYNQGLQWRKQQFSEGGKPNYKKSSEWLTKIKKTMETLFLKEVSCVPLQQSLRNLDRGFISFFRKRAKYPKFKTKRGRQSATFMRNAFTFRDNNLCLSGVGRLKIKWSMRITDPSSATITKSPTGEYYVTLTAEEEPKPLPETGKSVGIDLGVKTLATLSDGIEYANPKIGAKYAPKLAKQQRDLARKRKGSRRREKQRIRVAKTHEKIRRSRKDRLDKMTTEIVRNYDTVCVETLSVKDMVSDPDYAKSVSDCAFYATRKMLEYKCLWYGRKFVAIDRFEPSTKRCSSCGNVNHSLTIKDREWECQCGVYHGRDLNAAKNILAVGQTVLARGERVRPKRLRPLKASLLETRTPVESGILAL